MGTSKTRGRVGRDSHFAKGARTHGRHLVSVCVGSHGLGLDICGQWEPWQHCITFSWGNRIGAQLEKSGLLASCSKYGTRGTLGVF